ncbi:hypothetical protein ACIA5G_39310 [Amycolatopsis sp. NPDC051758]|uniref:hypothetical protein n=1 Tax=Amycolatopsis sp. NPDC051758 TaxID=3363935 RepID=UPI00379155A0
MQIASVAELNAVLRLAAKAASPPWKYLAQQAGIPRSQLYRLTNPEKPTLPRDPRDVRALLEACSAPNDQVVRILEQWHELDVKRHHLPAQAEPDDVAGIGTAAALSDANGEPVASAAVDDEAAGNGGYVATGVARDQQQPDVAERLTWLELAMLPVLAVGVTGVLAGTGGLTSGWALMIVLFLAVISAMAACLRCSKFMRRR